jgi:hypothetical protein
VTAAKPDANMILGIDPGWSGGAALMDSEGQLVDVQSFANQTEQDIITAVRGMIFDGPKTTVFLEAVHSMPKQGVSSSFKFGMIYGLLRGLTIGVARVIDVTPQRWQKALGCMTHGDKNISKAKAQMLFPGVKVTHGNADALLIAYYGYEKQLRSEK